VATTLPWAIARAHQELDLAAIVEIDRASFPASAATSNEEFERPWVRSWVARPADGPAPVAYLTAWRVADELHVLSVATLPTFRRKGAARALLDAALEFARDDRVRLVVLEVRRSNRAAIHLYRALGFSAMAVRPRYYADNSEDAIEMHLALDPQTGSVKPPHDEVAIEET
jgi:[ribosomal protein S18]-alanine N-acetyltransferase